MINKIKRIISPFAVLSVLVFIIIGIVYMLTGRSYRFADLINGGISQPFRQFMASIGDIFPFSLFEMMIASLPILLALLIYIAVRVFRRGEGRIRFVTNIAAVALLIYSGHLLALGVGYNATPLSRKMELSRVEVTKDNLTETLTDLRDEINYLSDIVPRDDSGVFVHGYSYPELSVKIAESYITLADRYGLPGGYYSSAKGVMAGEVMSYLGITGIYTYLTGEANVNTSYPDYVTLFTAAHEMAHQRGILRENEANFIAYLVLSRSDDASLRYSAAMNMYNYFASALYRTDKDAYYEVVSGLCDAARVDMRAANAVSEKYGDTILEEISDWINDRYLQSSGTEGIISYSMVVQLVLAYRASVK